jgi:hypothetical protein
LLTMIGYRLHLGRKTRTAFASGRAASVALGSS